jgi:hypothetical protein
VVQHSRRLRDNSNPLRKFPVSLTTTDANVLWRECDVYQANTVVLTQYDASRAICRPPSAYYHIAWSIFRLMSNVQCGFLVSLQPSKQGLGWSKTILGDWATNAKNATFTPHQTWFAMQKHTSTPQHSCKKTLRLVLKTPVRYISRDLHMKYRIYLGFLSRELNVSAFVFLPFIHIHNGTCSAIVWVLALIKTFLQLSEVKAYFRSLNALSSSLPFWLKI